MTRAGTTSCGQCQCRFGSSDCVAISGQGSMDDPFVPEPILKDDDANLLECGPGGFAAFLPPIYLDPPACHVYATGDQTIAYDAAQVLFFNEERYDTDNMHDNLTASSRITFNTPGVYFVTLNIRWQKTASDSGDVALFLRRNGAEFIALDSFPITNSDSFAKQSVSRTRFFEAGDYVEGMAKQDVLDDEDKVALRVTVERMSPVFAASFIRSEP